MFDIIVSLCRVIHSGWMFACLLLCSLILPQTAQIVCATVDDGRATREAVQDVSLLKSFIWIFGWHHAPTSGRKYCTATNHSHCHPNIRATTHYTAPTVRARVLPHRAQTFTLYSSEMSCDYLAECVSVPSLNFNTHSLTRTHIKQPTASS